MLSRTECGALLPPNVHWKFYPCWIERLCRCRSSPGSCYSSGGSQHSSQTGKSGSSLGRGTGTSAPLGLILLGLQGRTAKNSCSSFHLCQVTGEMKGPMAQQVLPILLAKQIKRSIKAESGWNTPVPQCGLQSSIINMHEEDLHVSIRTHVPVFTHPHMPTQTFNVCKHTHGAFLSLGQSGFRAAHTNLS